MLRHLSECKASLYAAAKELRRAHIHLCRVVQEANEASGFAAEVALAAADSALESVHLELDAIQAEACGELGTGSVHRLWRVDESPAPSPDTQVEGRDGRPEEPSPDVLAGSQRVSLEVWAGHGDIGPAPAGKDSRSAEVAG